LADRLPTLSNITSNWVFLATAQAETASSFELVLDLILDGLVRLNATT